MAVAKTKNVSIILPENEWKLIAALLEASYDEFHEHGYNDLPQELAALLPRKRWEEIAEEQGVDGDDWRCFQRDDLAMKMYLELIRATIEGDEQ